jgi:hypothetical protein
LIEPVDARSREAVFALEVRACAAVQNMHSICTAAQMGMPGTFAVHCFDHGFAEKWLLEGTTLNYSAYNAYAEEAWRECRVDLSVFGSPSEPQCTTVDE